MGDEPTTTQPDYEWEICRENIRPLRSGRRMAAIKEALSSTTSAKNYQDRVKEKFEEVSGSAAESADPIELWLEFIRWFDESFPFGRQKLFYEYLWKIVLQYGTDERYLNDERMLRIWDKMAENSLGNGWKVYQHANTIGSLKTSAIFYAKWAKCFEYAGLITEARKVFQRARANCATPINLLNDEENAMEMREIRRVIEERANDSWQQDTDDMVIDEDDKRIALTRLQGFGEERHAPIVRQPHLVGEGGSLRIRDGQLKKASCSAPANGFQIFTEKENEYEQSFLQGVYEMNTHIEHIHLINPEEHKEDVLRRVPIKKNSAPQSAGFTIYDESADENTRTTKTVAKPKLMLIKSMREHSIEEVRCQKYFEANGISDEKIY
ncbi:unnamed protein product, partial [Mesorhabditis belari]|uniref:BUB1 N-terminal domain-containing protein n=1 Tax=Mesorhabditis belari TaxID=2138241 RepID=A0AAF3EJC0_9BILA